VLDETVNSNPLHGNFNSRDAITDTADQWMRRSIVIKEDWAFQFHNEILNHIRFFVCMGPTYRHGGMNK
jgi:hypothetical protein